MTEAEQELCRDLAAQIGEPVRDIRPIPEGHSGFTYWVELDGRRAVLRLPPPGARIAGPADIPRQARIMAALSALGLPVPAVLAHSATPAVGGRPFVLMEASAGERVEVALGRGVDPLELAGSAVAVLRRLQAVPLEATGIGDENPMPAPGELARWTWLMERAPAELTTRAPHLAGQLAARWPLERPPVLVHGDYHMGNMLFHGGHLAAVLDWEIAQLGQPLLDLCCLGVLFHGSLDLERLPTEALREMYGADPADYRWYLALTYYKYAAILGYNLMLHRRGKRPDPSYEQRTGTIVGFIDEGIALLR